MSSIIENYRKKCLNFEDGDAAVDTGATVGGAAIGTAVLGPGVGTAVGGAVGKGVLSSIKGLFGAPAVSVKKDELHVMSSPNSNNLYRLVYTGFRPNIKLSNAYVFDHIVPDTKAGLLAVGLSGDYANSWDFHQYTINDIYNKVGANWDSFLAKLKDKYGMGMPNTVVNNVQYIWEVKAFADLFNTYAGNIDNFIADVLGNGGSVTNTNSSIADNSGMVYNGKSKQDLPQNTPPPLPPTDGGISGTKQTQDHTPPPPPPEKHGFLYPLLHALGLE